MRYFLNLLECFLPYTQELKTHINVFPNKIKNDLKINKLGIFSFFRIIEIIIHNPLLICYHTNYKSITMVTNHPYIMFNTNLSKKKKNGGTM